MKSLWHEIRCGTRVVDTFPSKREALATIHILDAIHPGRKYKVLRAKSAPTQFVHDPSLLQGSEQIPALCLSATPPAPSLPAAAVEWLSPRTEEQVHAKTSTRQTHERESILLREAGQ